MITWSDGGGTQSAAILVLIAQGRLPKPDIVVMADTGREATETWEYVNAYHRPILASLGIELHIAPHSLATVDLYAGNGDVLIPAYTENGKLPTFCSDKWKKQVVRRYLRSLGVKDTVMWLGMSLDETDRMALSDVDWITNEYPLIGYPTNYGVTMRRHECAALVEDYGLPTPPKSSCWFCPHRRNAQWRKLRDDYPVDWLRACAADAQITKTHGVYLHESREPLEFSNLEDEDDALPLFSVCDSGYCMV